MNRNKGERFLFGCLLVALMVGIISVKVWIMSVEHRFVEVEEIFWISLKTDNSHTNTLRRHEYRLRVVEGTAWATWDHHAPCDGWPTQQQIAQGER